MVDSMGTKRALLLSILGLFSAIRIDGFSIKVSCRPRCQPRRIGTFLHMVATELPFRMSKYPTERGSEVDSRKIVGDQQLSAIRLSHILFSSQELATNSLGQVCLANISFDELAKQISNCAETREQGGFVGWVSLDDEGSSVNNHLDLILPPDARKQVLQLSTKVRTACGQEI